MFTPKAGLSGKRKGHTAGAVSGTENPMFRDARFVTADYYDKQPSLPSTGRIEPCYAA